MGEFRITSSSSLEENKLVYSFRSEIAGNIPSKSVFDINQDEKGEHFFASDEKGQILATISMNSLDTGFSEDFFELLSLEKFLSIFARSSIVFVHSFFIRPEASRTIVFKELFFSAFEKIFSDNVQCIIAFCQPSLIRIFEYMGFRRYTDNFRTLNGLHGIPMFLLTDVRYIRQINSVFTRIHQKHGTSPEISYNSNAQAMIAGFSEFLSCMLPSSMTDDSWRHLATRISNISATPASEIFEGMTATEISRIIEQTTSLITKPNDKVFTKDTKQNIFLVLAGVFSEQTTEGALCLRRGTYGPGDVFGEISHVESGKRTSDIVCLIAGKISIIDEYCIDRIKTTDPTLAINLMKNLVQLMTERVEQTHFILQEKRFPISDDSTELFHGLQPIELTILLDLLPTKKILPGETIFKTGDPPGAAYLVISGEFEVLHGSNAKGQMQTPLITKVRPGDIVGELALIDMCPRSADVSSLVVTEAYEISRYTLDKLVQAYPILGQKLLMNFARLIARRIRETTNRLAAALGWSPTSDSKEMMDIDSSQFENLEAAFRSIISDYNTTGKVEKGYEKIQVAIRKKLKDEGYEFPILQMLELNILGSFAGWIDFIICEKKAGRDRLNDFARHLKLAFDSHCKKHTLSKQHALEITAGLANAVLALCDKPMS
ncbi:MAG: cyclic nucleotide-binding domain-containing protein [Candidatus Riflebacteria bacterium]|nr:cyclic nucleotide-binding domain-containing protein [Candidatus Riflebacteria bacterium]